MYMTPPPTSLERAILGAYLTQLAARAEGNTRQAQDE